jgi:hypothetical protein
MTFASGSISGGLIPRKHEATYFEVTQGRTQSFALFVFVKEALELRRFCQRILLLSNAMYNALTVTARRLTLLKVFA